MKEMCEVCEGKGKIFEKCGKCNGDGRIKYSGQLEKVTCERCNGAGRTTKVCRRCNGKGDITLNDLARLISQMCKETVERIKEPKCRACDDTGRVTEYSAEGPEGSYPCSCSAGSRYR